MTIRQLPPPRPAWAKTGSHEWAWEDTRLRDLRRLAAARRKWAQRDGGEIRDAAYLMQAQELMGLAGAMRPIYELWDIPSRPTAYWHVELAERALDMLISKYGPNASAADVWDALVQEQRSASDSASDSTAGAAGDTSDPARGAKRAGDDASNGGASGESLTGGEPWSEDDAQQDAEQGDDRGADEVTASGMDSGADPAPSEESDHRQDKTDASASLGVDDQSDHGQDGDTSEEAGEGSGDGTGETGEEAGEEAGEGYCPTEDGGRTAKVLPSLAQVTEVARIARALQRLMADTTRPEPSPLWDGKRVVRELVSRQVRLHRMRRDMPAVRGLLVLYDISGSCAWIAARTWGIASFLASKYSGFYAAQTPATEDAAEGSLDPASIVGRGATRFTRLPPIIGGGYGDDVAGWRRLRSAGISHVLVFGDAHGTAGYLAAAAAGIRVLWANPNKDIAPRNTTWCDYTLIEDDIAAAVETLTWR